MAGPVGDAGEQVERVRMDRPVTGPVGMPRPPGRAEQVVAPSPQRWKPDVSGQGQPPEVDDVALQQARWIGPADALFGLCLEAGQRHVGQRIGMGVCRIARTTWKARDRDRTAFSDWPRRNAT
jgi:hypothetical protein